MGFIRRNWVYLFCAATIPIGYLLFAHGLTYPVYTDQALASELKMAVFDSEETRSLSQLGDALRSLRTPRHAFMQGGISLGLAGLAVAGLFAAFRQAGGRGINTPREAGTFIRLGLAATALFWASEFFSYDLDIRRGDWLVGGGPAAAAGFLGMVILAPVSAIFVWAVGRAIASKFGKLPVSLANWDSANNACSWRIMILFALPAVLCGYLLAGNFTSSNFAQTPALITFLYVILASRAAWLVSSENSQD